MHKFAIRALGASAALALAVPATAHAQWNHHDYEHDQLDQEHADAHDQLEYEHRQAHEEGLTPWEHERLHQNLDNQHEETDYAIELQHQRQHMRDSWRHHRRSYSYPGYGYQNNGYQNYGYQNYGYARQRPYSNFSLFYGF